MRAIVLLCLLHGAFVESQFDNIWDGPSSDSGTSSPEAECLVDQATCGCCLMQKKMQRMEMFFNMNVEALTKNLTCTKTAVNDMRASRSAFSVALNHSGGYGCFGPFDVDRLIPYQHVFLNLGENYNAQASNFTAPLSGVYSLAVTVYSGGSLDGEPPAAAGTAGDLLVNDRVVASLKENNSLDRVDSATAVVSVKLKAGDTVAVSLPKGYHVCDDDNYFNTFTGFLLYPCEVMKE